MKHTSSTFSTSAPIAHIEYDNHGFPLAPCEYQDYHGNNDDDNDIQAIRSIANTLDDNNTRIQRITDSIIELFARIK